MTERTHVTWHEHQVSGTERERAKGHRGCLVWLTGLSGSGKSTLANAIDHRLHAAGCHSYILDGDNIRHGLNAAPEMLREKHGEHFAHRFGLGFSAEDREENIRRIGCVGELFVHAGLITLTAFVSPYRRDRDAVRQRIEANCGRGTFVEVYVDAPLEVCEARDPKGLYRKARAGELRGMTGIDDPYEPPNAAELHLDSAGRTVEQMTEEVIAYLRDIGVMP